MTVTPTAVAARPSSVRRPRRALLPALSAVAVLAFGVRLWLLAHGGPLAVSNGYDDGVYYAAADAFVHGRWPYADFLLLHPPGIVVALAPFAALGSVLGDPAGLIAARIAFLAIGAVNSALIALVAARRSRTAAVIAGGFAAVFGPLADAERSTLLEPLATVLLLVAVLLVRRGGPRAVVAAGVLAGLSVDVKIWYVVPVAVLLVLLPDRARFAGGAAAGAAALALPFLLRDPVAMVREVVLDQLGRPRPPADTFAHRVLALGGSPVHLHPTAASLLTAERVSTVLIAISAVAAVAAWRVRWARPFLVLTAVTAAVLLATPSFFTHYVAFTAPWLAIVVGVGWGEVLARLRRRGVRVAAAGLLLVLIVAANEPLDRARVDPAEPVAAIAPAARAVRGCVQSDDPGLLAETGVLSSDLARGCDVWPDVTGWTYDRYASGTRTPRRADARWNTAVLAHLLSGDAVVVDRSATGLSAASRRRIAALPVLAGAPGLVLHATRADAVAG